MESYVIFFCDDCDRLEPAITAFKKVHPGTRVHTVSEVGELIGKIEQKKPQLLLLYFHDPQKSPVEILKVIRENTESRSIPVLVYHQLPEAKELELAFASFRRDNP